MCSRNVCGTKNAYFNTILFSVQTNNARHITFMRLRRLKIIYGACQTVEIIKWSKYYSQSKSDAYCFKHIVIFQTGRFALSRVIFQSTTHMCVYFENSRIFNKRLQPNDNKQILMEYFFFGDKTMESS